VGLLDLFQVLNKPGLSVIAEIKKASPSKGVINANLDPLELAREFQEGGAAALSVLTDRPFFQGHPDFLREISSKSILPVLRKDFLIDEAQVYESRILGADAVLLIVRILSHEKLLSLFSTAEALGMTVLVEAHDENEITRAHDVGASMIGVNNRNLDDFSVSIDCSMRLRKFIRNGTLAVSESGIKNAEDAAMLAQAGYDAILIGESLAENPDRVKLLQSMAAF